jgi:hypothetical protein
MVGETAPAKGMSILGLLALVLGVVAIPVAIIPCLGIITLPVSGLGALLGLLGIVVSVSGKKSGLALPLIGFILSAVAFAIPFMWGAAATSELEKDKKEIREGQAVTISAEDLSKALKDNKSKENDSKVLEVAGEVESASGNAVHLKGAEGAPTITCYFEDDQKASIEKLKKGDKVTVRGRWASLVGALGQQALGRCIIKK